LSESLGEFEQLVLLAVLQLDTEAYAAGLRQRIESAARRRVTRGALYATLDRLTAKGMLHWEVEDSTPERGGIPRRRFRITRSGLAALRRSFGAIRSLAKGLESQLGEV
jgi:DNA-binding PadR family transcriptional regulator